MSDSKILQTRIKNKSDTSANWAKVPNFIPLDGEVIIYSDMNNVKIGDGKTKIGALPFLLDDACTIVDLTGGL